MFVIIRIRAALGLFRGIDTPTLVRIAANRGLRRLVQMMARRKKK